ncbi:MAG: S8 family serine peptidase [Nitrososphaerota archaeon]
MLRKRLVYLIILSILFNTLSTTLVVVGFNSSSESEHAPGRVLVKFKLGRSYVTEASRLSQLIDRELKHYGIVNISLLKVREGLEVSKVLSELSRIPSIEYAEPDYRIWVEEVFPNDPMFQYQWSLHNTGQIGGLTDADIDAPEAWTETVGTESIIIAVIDTGIDYRHPDLAGNIWINPFETVNGVDDDGNGYVDDIYGADTCNDDGDPMDDHGHGTAVAGVIGALGNNGLGVTGINWRIKIMALKFADATGSGYTSDAIEAIEYVIGMKRRGINIRITNNSWGGGSFSRSLYDAIRALENEDILFVAAAGNQAKNNDLEPHYPSSYNLSNIISVAATDDRDELAWFSNWGQLSVDLAAPGQYILSTFLQDSYQWLSGTSMAAPHVSGVAALILSKHPSYSYLEVKRLILSSVDEYPSLINLFRSGGRLNAYNSLRNQGDKIKILPITISQNFKWSISDNVILKVEVIAGPNPVIDANVSAAIYVNQILLKEIRLSDDGFPPDNMGDDGIYVGQIRVGFPGKTQILITASKEGLQEGSKIFTGEVYLTLTDFPSPFVRDGIADYAIVLGDSFSHGCFSLQARTIDALGSSIISARIGLESEEGLPELYLDTGISYCVNGVLEINWSKIDSSSIISVGGPGVNMVAYRYNSSSPFKWIYRLGYGSSIYSELTQRFYNSIWESSDYSIIQTIVDQESGKPILLVWGLTGYGTLAGSMVLARYDQYRSILVGRAVIIKWEDSNANNRVDYRDIISLIEFWEG